MKKKKDVIVIFDMGNRSMTAYSDLTDAAGHIGTERHKLDYALSKDRILYTGFCFVGRAAIQPSNRGGNKNEKQGFQ